MVRNNQAVWFLLAFLMIGFSHSRACADALPGDRYILGPGDILDISVWKNDALTKLVPVLPDGYVSFPLVGEIKAAGRTLAQFQNALKEKLIQYIPQPSLSVIVQKVNMKIYVIGKVNHPGMFGLNTNIKVLQALTMAGGLNPFAKRDEIKILRKSGNNTRIYTFNYDDVSSGRNLEQDIEIVRGDVIVVP